MLLHSSLPSDRRRSPPSGPGWVHELKHDGYRLQIHVRDGRVRLYTMNGNDWTKRYPRIVESVALGPGQSPCAGHCTDCVADQYW